MPLSAIAFVLRCKMEAMVLEDGTRLWSITDPITRPMFPQSHACYELQLRRAVNSRSCGLQPAAVAWSHRVRLIAHGNGHGVTTRAW